MTVVATLTNLRGLFKFSCAGLACPEPDPVLARKVFFGSFTVAPRAYRGVSNRLLPFFPVIGVIIFAMTFFTSHTYFCVG
jgi:hypothetical protein